MEITKAQVLAAIKKGNAERLREEIEYVRFRERSGKIPRGTILTRDRIIWGYERIPRIFTLAKGIARNVKSATVCIEEKIDGFNLRIAEIDGKILAFTRGGYLDAFATEKARSPAYEGFFRDFPKRVLCGEMVGNTPYTEPTDEFDVRLYVFDIDDGSGKYLPCGERYALLKKYGIESVPVLGKFKSTDIKGIRNLALSLNRAHREGMVIKSPDRAEAVKYVTPNSDIEDIAKCSPVLFDMPIGFYIQRVFRSGISIRDFGMDRKEYARLLGDAFYSGLIRGIEGVEEGRGAQEVFEILISDPKTWETIHRHMSKEVRLEVISNREESGGRRRIRFRKVYKKTTKKLHDAISGKSEID